MGSIENIQRAARVVMGDETNHPSSPCCECGKMLDRCTGHGCPEPGDGTLCINCGCLNIFDSDLRLRRPTDDEIFAAAKMPVIQIIRRLIEKVNNDLSKNPDEAK
jgi:hypothetical protein